MKSVYPYIHSRQDELRYSLRSLEMYTDCEPVIIGEKPEWYAGEFIPFPSVSHHKIVNVYFKIKRACLEISDTFLLMNDDVFLLQEPEMVHYTNGTIEDLYLEYCMKYSRSYYTECLQKTLYTIGNVPNQETHTPMLIGTDFLDLEDDWFVGEPCLFRTVYGSISTFETKDINRGPGYRHSEAKYYTKLHGDDLFKWIEGLPCFSTPDRVSINSELNQLYPSPSKWEKGQ